MMAAMEPLLYAAGVDIFIAGHVHAYERMVSQHLLKSYVTSTAVTLLYASFDLLIQTTGPGLQWWFRSLWSSAHNHWRRRQQGRFGS